MSTDFTQIDFTNSGKELLGAFVKFSADVGNVEKNKTNPHFKSTYADLAGAMNASREHLAKHELSVMQHPFTMGQDIGVTTLLIHSSGQSISSTFLIRPKENSPQALGSAVTYARRYAFMAILGIAPEDDDGNAACQKSQNQSEQRPKAAAPSNAPSPVKRNDEKPKPDAEVFDNANMEHLDRLEVQLGQHLVPKNLWTVIAADLHGKPMLPSTLKTAIEKVCGAGYLTAKMGESA